MITPMPGGPDRSIRSQVEAHLAVYLGPHTAQTAVKTFSLSKLGVAPDALSPIHLGPLCDALRPMLRTLLGAEKTTSILERILKEVR